MIMGGVTDEDNERVPFYIAPGVLNQEAENSIYGRSGVNIGSAGKLLFYGLAFFMICYIGLVWLNVKLVGPYFGIC
jgi:hypothetical protein